MELKIEYLPITELKPYENNARKHAEADVEAIKKSIEEFGFNDPIGIWHDTIVEGHGRLLAAQELEMAEVPVIRLDHMTDEERRAYALAHNKTAELSEWDFEMLDTELEDIFDIDMSQFGFDISADDEPIEIIEDEVPETAPPMVRLGDIWQLGNHRLICGDSTDVNVIDRLMDGAKADIVYTDPPYGMGLDPDFSSMHSKMNTDFGNRKMKGTNYLIGKVDTFSADMVQAIYSLNASETFMFGADYYAELIPNRNEGSWIVWDKRTSDADSLDESNVALDRGYGSCFELCYSKKKHKRNIARIKWSGLFGMEQEFDRKRVHPTQKPVKLAAWFLDKYSKESENVVDIFGGSGSTLIACEQLGRKCYMAELDPKYCDVIIQRYINFKGSADDVFLIRDGEKIPYEEVK